MNANEEELTTDSRKSRNELGENPNGFDELTTDGLRKQRMENIQYQRPKPE